MTRRLRILYLIDKIGDAGGAERAATGLALHLPSDRFETWMCSTRHTDPAVAARLDAAGVRHVDLGRRSKIDVHRLLPLAALLRRESFDLLHSHMFGSNVWGCVLGRGCRVPVVIAHEHTWSYEGRLRRWVDGRIIGRLADRFVAVSTLDAHRMETLEGVAPGKIVTIPNSYIPRPPSSVSDLRAEFGMGTEPLIVTVALLRPQKALDVLLDAFALVLESLPSTRLVIAGDGPCRADLERRAAELGLAGGVHFLGLRTDIDALLASADVAALSSDFEGTPLVAFECMANGTPLVATAVGGMPDVIESGQTGLLVPPRDPRALADGLINLLTDPGRRERMAAAATERLSAFTLEAAVERYAALYEQLVSASAVDTVAGPAAHAHA